MKKSFEKSIAVLFFLTVCLLTPSMLIAQDSDGDGLADAFETA